MSLKSKYTTFPLKEQESGRRLDSLLKQFLRDLRVSSLYMALRKGDIRLNDQKVQPYTITQSGDILSIHTPLLKGLSLGVPAPKRRVDFIPEILWQDTNFLVINKPLGWLVTPSAREGEPTLKDWVLDYLRKNYREALAFRPAPLHRLDRNTTGVLVFSASLWGAQKFSEALREYRIEKTYLALVEGYTPERFEWIDDLIRDKQSHVSGPHTQRKGKRAITYGETIVAFRGRSLIQVVIETGVTHQIRAQASLHGFPLVGDIKYGGSGRRQNDCYCLHAYSLRFPQEFKVSRLVAPLPQTFLDELTGWSLPSAIKR